MDVQKYIDQKKELQRNLLAFLESSDENQNYFQDLIDHFNKCQENPNEFNYFIQLLANISSNHHRHNVFLKNIEQILLHFAEEIKQTLPIYEIFNIFKSNKLILLFLIEKKIIPLDESIINLIMSENEPNDRKYCHFFMPEIKEYIDSETFKTMEDELLKHYPNIFDNFDEKRHLGENDSYISSLIRHDSVDEFVAYVNRSNIPLSSTIKQSIFETNSFLIEKEATLIEYAAFFGAISIFQYLRMNDVQLKSKLWINAIHSQNPELIHLLEQIQLSPPKKSYVTCFIESVKCHHNDFAEYINNNLSIETQKEEEVVKAIFKSSNYEYFPYDFNQNNNFYYLCSHNYYTIVNLFIKSIQNEIESQIILKTT